MNKLELRLKGYHPDKDNIEYLVVEIKVDGKRLTDFSAYATDLKEFARSIEADGRF